MEMSSESRDDEETCLLKESPALSPIRRAWSVKNKGYVDLNTACVG